MRFPLALLLLAITPASAPTAGLWTCVGSDFHSQPINLASIDQQGVKVLADSGASLRNISWNDILELDHAIAAQANPPAFTLYLNGGDAIAGSPISITGDNLAWDQPLAGRLEISEDRVNAIVRGGQSVPGLSDARAADSVRLTNGDVTTGVVQSLDGGGVSILPAGADSPARIGLDKVVAILLADTDPTTPSAARNLRVWLSDGSSLTVTRLRLPETDTTHLLLDINKRTSASVDLASVTCIEQSNGPVRWLTSLTPAAVTYHPYLEENFPPQFDHPVDDPSLTIRQKYPPFHHGIGVHSYTKLTYAIPPGTHSFRTQFGIQRIIGCDMTKADVTARLLLDGKVVRQFPHVHYGNVFPPVLLDVSSAKNLSLEVDYGQNLDAQDRFLWLDPAFLAAPASTEPGH